MILRPPLRIHGGKYYMVDTLLQMIPQHKYYCEVFGGMASLLFNKIPSIFEEYNDVDYSKFKLMFTLKHHGNALKERLQTVKYCRETWDEAVQWIGAAPDFESTVYYIVKYRMSRGGLGNAFSESTRTRRGMAEGESAWKSFIDLIPRYSARLQTVTLKHWGFKKVMEGNLDDPNTFFYLDPPYFPSSRKSPDIYTHELSEDGHKELAELCKGAKAKILISGYDCQAYRSWFYSWRRFEIPMPNHSGQTKQKERRTEILWCNY